MNLSFTNMRHSNLLLALVALSLVFMSCEGPAGSAGPQGAQGPEGPQGAVGPAGEDGSQIYSDTGAPDAAIGAVGDYYLDTDTGELYGPKDDSGWGSPSIVLMGEDGQDGADGADGEDGSQIYSGTGAPDATLGVEGDYYLDTSSYELYGPKTVGGWGTPLNLKGADGNANVTLYIFDPNPFTSTDSQHTFEISGLDASEIFDSSWDFAFQRGAYKQFIPGKISFGTTLSEFTVELRYDSGTGNVQFNVELINGSDYYPDELHIFKVAPSNIVNAKYNTKGPLSMESSRVKDYDALIDFYGMENIEIVDLR